MRPNITSPWGLCPRHGCTLLWNVILYGNCFKLRLNAWWECNTFVFLNKKCAFCVGTRLAMTKQSNSGKWKHQVMERKRSLLTPFLARFDQWASAAGLRQTFQNWRSLLMLILKWFTPGSFPVIPEKESKLFWIQILQVFNSEIVKSTAALWCGVKQLLF